MTTMKPTKQKRVKEIVKTFGDQLYCTAEVRRDGMDDLCGQRTHRGELCRRHFLKYSLPLKKINNK